MARVGGPGRARIARTSSSVSFAWGWSAPRARGIEMDAWSGLTQHGHPSAHRTVVPGPMRERLRHSSASTRAVRGCFATYTFMGRRPASAVATSGHSQHPDAATLHSRLMASSVCSADARLPTSKPCSARHRRDARAAPPPPVVRFAAVDVVVAASCSAASRVAASRVAGCRAAASRVAASRSSASRVAASRVVGCRVVGCRVAACRVTASRVAGCDTVFVVGGRDGGSGSVAAGSPSDSGAGGAVAASPSKSASCGPGPLLTERSVCARSSIHWTVVQGESVMHGHPRLSSSGQAA